MSVLGGLPTVGHKVHSALFYCRALRRLQMLASIATNLLVALLVGNLRTSRRRVSRNLPPSLSPLFLSCTHLIAKPED